MIDGRSSGAKPAPDYPIHAVSSRNVQLSDLFWSPRLETNRAVTIPLSFQMCEETGRIENFKVAAGLSSAKWTGMFGFNDSDVYKVVQGAADSLAAHPDARLHDYLNRLIAWINAAQEKDGYLYTEWTAHDRVAQPSPIRCCVPNPDKKWFNEKDSHELYNAGHMIEAAISHWEATGSDSLLKVAKKNADLLVETFGPGKLEIPSGHPEVELALVKLYRATNDERYLRLAKFLIDIRGRPTKDRRQPWGTYMQDNAPLVEQQKAVGHAVRAMYLYSAATDVAALTGDSKLGNAVDRIWENVVGQKTYVTGAIGATAAGEAFGADYELPNDKAYAETCANLATCFWNYRMFLRHGDAKYIDLLERALYNSAISGVALDGKSFFYPNPLASTGNYARSKWFDCACCPTNVCRFIPSIPGYVYATQDDTVFVNLFAAGSVDINLPGGKLRVQQATNYPWDGHVQITLSTQHADQHAVFKIRIPGWARGEAFVSDLYRFVGNSTEQYKISLNDAAVTTQLENGFATI
ncbi:MAG: glycoside hydrolase family 127 protein, partial [Candidatus Udaeobacter sp.]